MEGGRMEGGRLIGQGTFGCVFDPPLKCKEARSKQGKVLPIGKIGQPIDAEIELAAAKTLGAIPDASTYFVLPDPNSLCTPLNPSKANTNECKIIQRQGVQGMVHFSMPYGGITITKYLDRLQQGNRVFPFREIITRLLECGSTLALHGYVHYDISPRNILFDEKTGLPRLIDFGMSFSTRNITAATIQERWKVYSPEYDVEPPEISILTGLKKGMRINELIRDEIKKKSAIQSANVHAGLSIKTQLNSFINFWKSSKSMKEQDLPTFFKYYWPSFDAWSIGYVILVIFRYYIQTTHVSDDAKLYMTTKEILRGLLSMSPRTRIDCIEALVKFNPESPVITSIAGKKWLEERALIRTTAVQ